MVDLTAKSTFLILRCIPMVGPGVPRPWATAAVGVVLDAGRMDLRKMMTQMHKQTEPNDIRHY